MGNISDRLLKRNPGQNSALLKKIMQTVQNPFDEDEQKKVIAKLQSNQKLMAEMIIKFQVIFIVLCNS